MHSQPEHPDEQTPEPGTQDVTVPGHPHKDTIPLGSQPAKSAGDPEMIGPYRILGRIGAGGMGVVYRAEQTSPRRVVALKVIRSQAVTASAVRRFKLESQILGRLRHQGIAQIYEAGTWSTPEGELPFYAMEYVPEAMTLSEWVRVKSLDTKAILQLFTNICSAVGHAHLKGVIHRDLKPANILMTQDGQPKIIDFGVARSTDPEIAITTLETVVGVLIGTLQYMSPEQCGGDPLEIDTRSDVYALGVILYELLCGVPPYDIRGQAIQAAVRVVQQDDPVLPSTVNRRLRGDVEIITLKALEKSRDRRYQAASEMSADIQRFLDGMPIEAVRPTALYRLKKYVNRHRLGTTIATLLTVSAVISLIAAWQWSRADAARQERNRMVAELIDFYMVEHFQSISRLAGSQPAREVIIDRSLEYLDALRRDAEDDPDLQLILSQGLQAVGNNHWSMRMGSRGELAEAIEAWEASLASLRSLRAASPNDERLMEAATRVRTLLVDAYIRAGRVRDAATAELQAFGMLAELGDPLRSLDRARLHIDVLLDHANLAADSTVKRTTLLEAVAIAEQARSNWPDDAMLLRDLSVLKNRLGSNAMQLGSFDEALAHFEASLVMRHERLVAEPAGNSEQRDVMLTNRYIAQTLLRLGRVEEARALCEDEVLPMAERLMAQNTLEDGSVDMRSHRDLCIAQREYGEMLLAVQEGDDAAEVLSAAFVCGEAFLQAHPNDMTALRDYGRCGASLAGSLIELDRGADAAIVIDAVRSHLIDAGDTTPAAGFGQILAYLEELEEAIQAPERSP